MAYFIKRDFVKGDKIDYDAIEEIFKNDNHLLESWANNCGIDKNDDRCIYGWPDKFEYFYDGYMSQKINKIYLVTRRILHGDIEEADVMYFFTEYKKAILYVNYFEEKYNVSYDIDEVDRHES